jgi:hypothetical protein
MPLFKVELRQQEKKSRREDNKEVKRACTHTSSLLFLDLKEQQV